MLQPQELRSAGSCPDATPASSSREERVVLMTPTRAHKPQLCHGLANLEALLRLEYITSLATADGTDF